jgi:hypothetical protein
MVFGVLPLLHRLPAMASSKRLMVVRFTGSRKQIDLLQAAAGVEEEQMKKILARILLTCAVLSPAALADVYTLTVDDCSGGCGTPPFGTVTVVQGSNSNTVDITVALESGEVFATSGAGAALGFNISGAPAVTIGNLSSGFGVGPTSAHLDGTGTFDYTVECTSCGNGTSAPNYTGPLSFTVSASGGLAPSDFIANTNGYFFSVDIGSGCTNIGSQNVSCQSTGDVGSTGSVSPEPDAAVLYGTGLIVFGGWLRRRNRRAAKGA